MRRDNIVRYVYAEIIFKLEQNIMQEHPIYNVYLLMGNMPGQFENSRRHSDSIFCPS